MFDISIFNVFSWIIFGFVVGILVHEVHPKTDQKHILKDMTLAVLGSMVGGLTIIFFYGYTLLGLLTTSVVGGICFAALYIVFQKSIQHFHIKTPLHIHKPNSNSARYYTLPLNQKH